MNRYFWLVLVAFMVRSTQGLCVRENHGRGSPAFNDARVNLTACWLLESDNYYTTFERAAAAVDLAVRHANEYILPESIELNVLFHSAGPSCLAVQYAAMTNLLTLLQTGATCHVFIGLGCANTAVAIYPAAQILNAPILASPGAGASILAVGTRNNFPLLLRIAFGYQQLATFMSNFLLRNNYTHVTLLHDDSMSHFSILSKYIYSTFRVVNQKLFDNSQEKAFQSQTATDVTLKDLLLSAEPQSRVTILFAHAIWVRRFMIVAHNLNLTDESHVFLATEFFPLDFWGTIRPDMDDNFDEIAKEAFRNLLVFAMQDSIFTGREYDLAASFDDLVKHNALTNYNYSYHPTEKVDIIVSSYYESLMIYAQEVSRMRKMGLDFYNGTLVVQQINGSNYTGIAGPLTILSSGERDRRFVVRMFNPISNDFEVPNQYTGKVHWRSADGNMPPDEPICGFRNDKCVDHSLSTGMLTVAVLLPLLTVLGLCTISVVVLRKLKELRKDYNPNWWKISSDELLIKQIRSASSAATSKKSLASQLTTNISITQSRHSSYNCDILASYKGSLIAMNDVSSFNLIPTSDTVQKLGYLKAASHSNLQKFIGIGLDDKGHALYVVAELCAKGCLTDILENEMIKLDWSFKNSLIKDLVFGMNFLHSSPISSHGNLNSHNCLIDSRFTLKISEYGLPFFRDPQDLQPLRETDSERSCSSLLWRAPELLKQMCPPQGTQKGDVYSFSIILQQIILRSYPFQLPNEPLDLNDFEILKEVVAMNIPPVRPRVPRVACSNELYDLMERCWEEVPIERPTFQKIKEKLAKVIGDVGDNIVDLLLKRMEQYATDLEMKVAEKTQEFMEEKNRSEQLLNQLLPKTVAAALTRGEMVEPEAFDSVTIYFSDIVDFTTISAAGSPMDVVSLLNGLYTFFDDTMEKFDVYKVETIGDAYMVSSGLPARNGNRHAAEIASMSIALMRSVGEFQIPQKPGECIRIRIGINSGGPFILISRKHNINSVAGPCVAGVVGTKMPRYCLFGDTVNVASRMESTGEPMKIQISQATKTLLDNIGGYSISERGQVAIKGKGNLKTFWLIHEE